MRWGHCVLEPFGERTETLDLPCWWLRNVGIRGPFVCEGQFEELSRDFGQLLWPRGSTKITWHQCSVAFLFLDKYATHHAFASQPRPVLVLNAGLNTFSARLKKRVSRAYIHPMFTMMFIIFHKVHCWNIRFQSLSKEFCATFLLLNTLPLALKTIVGFIRFRSQVRPLTKVKVAFEKD